MRPLDDRALDRLTEVVRDPLPEHSRYQLRELVASGGMGSVYRAWDRVLEREVAVKVLRGGEAYSRLAARLDQEARILGRLDHPGLVPVHDTGVLADGRPFYVMRLIRGERLDRHLLTTRSLPERLRIFLRIAEPVAFAHAQHVIHRDLKPANIMVGPFGEVLVLDWGIAKVRGSETAPAVAAPPETDATGPGTVLGTVGFMAPEQEAGTGPVDERADVFSLGAILREMLLDLGRSPPRALVAVRDRALAARPADRYGSVTELAQDVAAFLDGRPVAAYRESWLERAKRFGARHQTALALIAAYLLMRLLLLLVQRG